MTVNTFQCEPTSVSPAGIVQNQVISYHLLDPEATYDITYTTTPNCMGQTYTVQMSMADGSTNLSVFGGTFISSTK